MHKSYTHYTTTTSSSSILVYYLFQTLHIMLLLVLLSTVLCAYLTFDHHCIFCMPHFLQLYIVGNLTSLQAFLYNFFYIPFITTRYYVASILLLVATSKNNHYYQCTRLTSGSEQKDLICILVFWIPFQTFAAHTPFFVYLFLRTVADLLLYTFFYILFMTT